MKRKPNSAFCVQFLPNLIQWSSALGLALSASSALAVDYYKANNTTVLNSNGAWVDLAGAAVGTTPGNTTASDTDTWNWDNRVALANIGATMNNDLRVKTIRVLDPAGAITIDGLANNRSITVISGGGIDMANATQDLTIKNLNTGSNVGLRLSSSGGNMAISVASARTLTLLSKIAAASNAAGTTSTVNFTGPGTMICNADMQANRLNIASGEVQLNLAGGSARPGNAATAFTNVNGGRLVVNNTAGSATGSGPVTVNSTATLTGQGIMSGVVTVNSGGTIIPRENAVGSLTAGSLTLAAGSIVKWEGVDPATADLIAVTTSDGLTINGGTFELYNPGTTQPFSGIGTFNLISYLGAINGAGIPNLAIAEATKIPGQTYTFGLAGGFVTLRIEVGSRPQSFWNVNANGTWATPANWTSNGVPNGVSAIANLGGIIGVPITAPRTVTLGAPATVGVLNFDSAQPFTLAGAEILTFDDDGASATLHVENGNHTISAPLSVPASGIIASVKNAGNTLTIDSMISSDAGGGIGKSGAGTLVLTADNSYTSLTSNGAGVLQLGAGGATGSVIGPIANSGTLRINRNSPFTVYSPISGTGGVDIAGTGTITLFNSNTFSGPTSIASTGALEISDNLALQNSTLTYSATSGILTYNSITSVTFGGLIGDKAIPLANSFGDPMSLTVGGNNESTSYTASTTGTGAAFTKTGTGTFSLAGTHAFSGNTTVSNGILSLNSGANLTTAAVNTTTTAGAKVLVNGGTLTSSAQSRFDNISAGLEVVTGTANFNGGITSENNVSNGAFFVNVSGGTVNAASMGMSRGNFPTYTAEPPNGANNAGLYIHGGAVSIAGALNIGNSASNSSVSTRLDSGSLTVNGITTVTINSPDRWSVLDIFGGTFTSTDTTAGGGVRLGGTTAGQVVLLVRGGQVNAERFQFGQAALAGTSILSQTAGSLYLGAGGMVIGSTNPALTSRYRLGGGVLGATADSTSNVPVSLTGMAAVTGADALDVPHSVTFSGNVDGSGGLVKSGSGTVSFTSSSIAFSGTVSVASGTLGIGGSTGALDVASTGTLIPSGTLNPQAASSIDGTLGIRYDVDNALLPGRVHSLGTLTIGAGSTLNISGLGTLTAPVYILASGAAGVTGSFTTVTGVPSGYTLNSNYNDGSGFPVIALVANTSSSPYDLWASSFSISGPDAVPTADYDFDGVKNLIEFALGTNPTTSSPGPVLGRSGDFLTLTFPHISGGNLTYIVEAGSDLISWTPVATYPSFASAGSTIYTDTVAISSAPRRMLRLRVVFTN